MTDRDQYRQWEETLIADMREHEGRPSDGPLKGHPLMVMYSTGAKSGERRRAIVTYSRNGDDYVVAGTAGGAKTDPAWVANVVADPNVTIEIGKRTFTATATLVGEGPERERLWDQHVEALPWFSDYPSQAGRDIPVVRLSPR
jgi:deazaflavin-dependent oxidoreductase (nitroreductase family)